MLNFITFKAYKFTKILHKFPLRFNLKVLNYVCPKLLSGCDLLWIYLTYSPWWEDFRSSSSV